VMVEPRTTANKSLAFR